MNKFNKRRGGLKLLYLYQKSSSLARLYSISFSIVKGSPLSAFNEENGPIQEPQFFSLRRNNLAKPSRPGESKQTINLTKYGSHHQQVVNKIKGTSPIPIQNLKEHVQSSNSLLIESARILMKNGRPEDAINLIKSSCKDKNGDLDIKNILLQDDGIEVIFRLHQAYAALGKLEEMNNIMQFVTNSEQYSKFQGEIIKLHADTENYVESLKLLDNMPYTPVWNLFFLGASKLILSRRPGSVHEIINFLHQYIEKHKHEINKTIADSSKHFQELTNNSVNGFILRIRKFFDATGPELDRVRFAQITISSLSRIEDYESTEILFRTLIDKNESNTDVLQKLKGIIMHTLISQERYEDAMSVFFDIKTPPNLKTYEKLMRVYIDIGQIDFAIYLCETYVKTPTTEIYVLLIKAHILKGNIERAEDILNNLFENFKLSESTKVIINTLLMSAYAEAGMILQVQNLFDSITKPDTRCYNELMKAYCHIGDTKRVKDIFKIIQSKDAVSFLYLLDSLAIEGDSASALKCYSLIPSPNHFHADAVVRAIITDTKCGGIDEAKKFFNTLKNPSIVTRKRILRAISKSGDMLESLNFFRSIPHPDTECYGILLRTFFYTEVDDVKRAEEFFQRIPDPDASCYASMISIYGKFRKFDMVDKMVHQFPSPSTIIAFFFAYLSNYSTNIFWERYESLVKQYPRCFTKPVYLEAIKEAVRYGNKSPSLDLFRIYLDKSLNKQTRDLLGLLLFIARESSYRENLTLVREIIDSVPKCVATPNTLEQIKEIEKEIEGL